MVAAVGALVARLCAGRLSAAPVEATVALCAAYLTLLGCGFVDSHLLSGHTILEYWLTEDQKRLIPASELLVVASPPAGGPVDSVLVQPQRPVDELLHGARNKKPRDIEQRRGVKARPGSNH